MGSAPIRLQDPRRHVAAGRHDLWLGTVGGRPVISKDARGFSTAEPWFYEQFGPLQLTWMVGAVDIGDTHVTLERVAGAVPISRLSPRERMFQLAMSGEVVAELHALTPPADAPSALEMPSLDPLPVKAVIWAGDAALGIARRCQRSPALIAACQRWNELQHESRGIIHGDLKPDNFLLSQSGVFLIDWEAAGVGSPFIDIGAVVGSIAMAWIEALEWSKRGCSQAVEWRHVEASVATFLALYGRPISASDAWTAATLWLLWRAVTMERYAHRGRDGVRAVLTVAEWLAERSCAVRAHG